jgi:hypothetical protein
MEQGVEPVARLFWQPRGPQLVGRQAQAAPLREPVITADPRAVQRRQERDLSRSPEPLNPGPADLTPEAEPPPAVAMPDPVQLPPPPGAAQATVPSEDPAGVAAPAQRPDGTPAEPTPNPITALPAAKPLPPPLPPVVPLPPRAQLP